MARLKYKVGDIVSIKIGRRFFVEFDKLDIVVFGVVVFDVDPGFDVVAYNYKTSCTMHGTGTIEGSKNYIIFCNDEMYRIAWEYADLVEMKLIAKLT